jgi:uncharacterized membrane protein
VTTLDRLPPSPRPGMTGREWLRKAAHGAAFAPALALPWLTPGQALVLAGGLVLFNLLILPRLFPVLFRPDAPGQGALEVLLYPVAVLALIAAYGYPALPTDPIPRDLADAGGKPAWYLVPLLAWFALAFVDASMGIGCRLVRRGPVLPWNPRKTLGGTALGFLGAALALFALIHLLRLLAQPFDAPSWAAALDPTFLVKASRATHIGVVPALFGFLALAVLAETLWFGIADNLVMPFLLCVLAPLVATPFLAIGGIPEVTWPLLVLPLGFGALSFAQGSLTAGGALLGTLLAFLVMAADPWLFAWLGGFFVLAVSATRFRFAGKAARKVSEGKDGRRGAAQVFGAMGAAAWMTPLVHLAESAGAGYAGASATAGAAPGSADPTAAAVHGTLLVCAAPFVAKVMDTVSSEMGKAIGGTTISLRSFRPVTPGAEGGVSLAGTLWGLAAALLLSLLVLPLGWGGFGDVGLLVGIALLANLFESYWGEWAARRGLDDGPQTNFLMTLFAALLAWVVWVRF